MIFLPMFLTLFHLTKISAVNDKKPTNDHNKLLPNFGNKNNDRNMLQGHRNTLQQDNFSQNNEQQNQNNMLPNNLDVDYSMFSNDANNLLWSDTNTYNQQLLIYNNINTKTTKSDNNNISNKDEMDKRIRNPFDLPMILAPFGRPSSSSPLTSPMTAKSNSSNSPGASHSTLYHSDQELDRSDQEPPVIAADQQTSYKSALVPPPPPPRSNPVPIRSGPSPYLTAVLQSPKEFERAKPPIVPVPSTSSNPSFKPVSEKVKKEIPEGSKKTQICSKWKDWKEGKSSTPCSYGKVCSFAHGEKELVKKPAPPAHKTQICEFWDNKQNPCLYGANCKFAHGIQELRRDYGLYKTRLCNNWDNEEHPCNEGAKCRFAHGENELLRQRSPENKGQKLKNPAGGVDARKQNSNRSAKSSPSTHKLRSSERW